MVIVSPRALAPPTSFARRSAPATHPRPFGAAATQSPIRRVPGTVWQGILHFFDRVLLSPKEDCGLAVLLPCNELVLRNGLNSKAVESDPTPFLWQVAADSGNQTVVPIEDKHTLCEAPVSHQARTKRPPGRRAKRDKSTSMVWSNRDYIESLSRWCLPRHCFAMMPNADKLLLRR